MARAAPAPAPAAAAGAAAAAGGGAEGGGGGVLSGSLLAGGLPRGVSLTGFSAVGDLPRDHYALPPEVRETPPAPELDEAREAGRASRLRELEKFPLSAVTRYDADESARKERGVPDDKRAVAVRRPDGSVAKSRGELTFYGAFTGGFSAGYWNTVGSKEGWEPATFVSSRSKRAEQPANQVEDLMDEEDLQNLQDHRRVLDRGAEERRALGEQPQAPDAPAARPRAGRKQQGADGLSYEGLLAAGGSGRGRGRGRAAPRAAAEEEESGKGAAGDAVPDAARDGRRLYMNSKRGRGTGRAHAYGDFGTGVFDKEDRDAWEDIYHTGDKRAEYDGTLAVADREEDKAEDEKRLEDRRLAGLEDVRASCAAVLKADGVQGLPGIEDPLLPEALREDLVEYKVGSSSRVFVGGLPHGCTDEMLSDYFSAYGTIAEAAVKKDPDSGKSRGFGFVAFESPGSVDMVMGDYEKHRIEDKWVEVKRAISQEVLEFKERYGSARLLLEREEDELREREALAAPSAAAPSPPAAGLGGPPQAHAEMAGGSSSSTAPGPDAQQQRALAQSAGPLWRAVSEENKKALLKNLGRAFVTGQEQDMDGKTARHEPFKSDPKKQKRYTAFCLALEGKASASEALRDSGGLGEAEREAELADFGRVYRLFRQDNPDADIEAALRPAGGPSLAPALQRTVQSWAPDKLLCKRWRVPAPEQDAAEGASLQAGAKRQKAYSAQVQRGLARAAWDAVPGAPAAHAPGPAPGPAAVPAERKAAARARCPQGPPPGSLFSAVFGDEDA